MDSLDGNKAIAAVLVAGIAFFITGLLGDNLVYEEQPAKPAIAIQGAETPAPGAAEQKPAGPEPIIPLLASADVQKGEAFANQVCAACHSFDKGGKPKIGPNLYGVVGGPHDHEAGFSYSSSLEKFKGQPWTYQALNQWLYDPATYAPGTHMTYGGIKKTSQRADVIAYLRTLSPNPVPLPSAEEVAKVKAAEAPAAKPAAASAAPAAAQKQETGGGLPPIAPMLASADVQKGQQIVQQVCAVCHTFNQGGKPLIGPNLYGIVGAPHDHEAGFSYSAALEKFKGQPWTYEALNHWLQDPAHYAPGTRMTYAGLKSEKQRADVIAYLRSLSPNPVPLPASETPTKAAQTAPAPGTAAPAGNHSALGSASAPNSAPASSPKTIGPPGSSYDANAQTPNAGTQAGGTGAAPTAPPAAPAASGKP
jgi:cytochrome c